MWRTAAALATGAALVVALAGQSPTAQTTAPPSSVSPISRDNSPQKSGTGIIRGRVVADTAGVLAPIRSARVTLGSGPTTVEPVFTDDGGRFALTTLAAGRYSVMAEKTGFVKTRYGSKNELDPPIPLDLADGAMLEGVEIRLPKGASIMGRIVDELGDPVVAAPISVGFIQIVGSETRFLPIARPASDTNDRGDYRIGGLAAGRYYVSVAGATEGATVFGAPTEWARTMTWVRTFYQSAPSLAAATMIVLGTGEERSGIDITLTPSHPAKLTVTLTDASGAPVEGMVNLVMIDESLGVPVRNRAMPFPPPNPAVPLTPRVITLDPGDWIGIGFPSSLSRPIMIKRFRVASSEESAVTFSPVNGARVAGRVVFEGGTPPVALTNLRVTTRLSGPEAGATPIPRVNGPVAADSTFELTDVFGTIDLQLVSPPTGWIVGSVIHGDRDLLDTPLMLNGGEEIRDVQIILNNQPGRLDGATVTAEGRSSAGCVVALFPDAAGPLSVRRTRLLRSDQNGRFAMTDLLPGNYFAAAATDVDASVLWTRDYLQRFQSSATRVRVTGGSTGTLTLPCLVTP